MKRSSILIVVFLTSAGAGVAQTEEWPQYARHGVDRASAAGKPNEAGALPESAARSEREAPDGARDLDAAAPIAATPERHEVGVAATSAPETRSLPATASPLSAMAVSGLMFLAAAGGLYRLRRDSQQ